MTQEYSSKEMLDYYLHKGYDDARKAKERGEMICWASSIAPNEICETMGIHVIYPENHAASIAARHGAIDLLEVAEAKGYSLGICSYARINLAYMDVKRCVAEEIPLPNFLLVCNNICELIMKWYENISYELDIPIIMIDVPYNYEEKISEHSIDYIVGQFEHSIKQIEEITGKIFENKRFDEVMKISLESSYWWVKAMGLASANPSPLNGFDIFNYMALIVCMRGKTWCRDTFIKLVEELEEKIEKKYSAFKEGEKFRIMWDGIACFPYLNHNFKTLKSYGINMTGSTYPTAWAIDYEKGDLRSMAKAYTSIGNNMSLKNQIDLRNGIVKDYGCEGVAYHMNRSCKTMGFLQVEIQREVAEQTKTPYITFDGDQSDPRNFSMAQFETRVQGLSEMMEQIKENK